MTNKVLVSGTSCGITRRGFLSAASSGIGAALLCDSSVLQATSSPSPEPLLPVPDHLVVLNFDDGLMSDISYAAPLLVRYGFGASFYITEGLTKVKGGEALTWNDARTLSDAGFEIGNHTESHPDVTTLSRKQLLDEVESIERRCTDHGIPKPTTFVYPAFRDSVQSAQVLRDKGYLFARRGVGPEYPDAGCGARGPVYDPQRHHPLLLPTTGYAGPDWHLEDLVWAVDQAKDGEVAIICFHGVPYPGAPWVSVAPLMFEKYMKYLHDRRCTVIATRDLIKYVQPSPLTKIPLLRERGPST